MDPLHNQKITNGWRNHGRGSLSQFRGGKDKITWLYSDKVNNCIRLLCDRSYLVGVQVKLVYCSNSETVYNREISKRRQLEDCPKRTKKGSTIQYLVEIVKRNNYSDRSCRENWRKWWPTQGID